MSKTRVTVSLAAGVLAEVRSRATADARSVSSWLERAIAAHVGTVPAVEVAKPGHDRTVTHRAPAPSETLAALRQSIAKVAAEPAAEAEPDARVVEPDPDYLASQRQPRARR